MLTLPPFSTPSLFSSAGIYLLVQPDSPDGRAAQFARAPALQARARKDLICAFWNLRVKPSTWNGSRLHASPHPVLCDTGHSSVERAFYRSGEVATGLIPQFEKETCGWKDFFSFSQVGLCTL